MGFSYEMSTCPQSSCSGLLTHDTESADVKCTKCNTLFDITLEDVGYVENGREHVIRSA